MSDRIGKGKIVWFDDQKNFGFIEEGEDKQVFFHISSARMVDGHNDQLQEVLIKSEGAEVEFVAVKEPKGWKAIEVRLTKEELDKR